MDVSKITAWALQKKPVRAFLRYSEHNGALLADSVTYRALFSIFAGVLLGFSAAALWLSGNPAAWQALLDAVDNVIPGLVGDDGIIKPDAIEAPAGLSIAGAIALIGLIGAAIGAIGSLRTAMHTLADKPTGDLAFYWVLLRNLAIAIGTAVALGASAVITVLGTAGLGIVADWFGLSSDDPLLTFGTRALSILVTFALDAVAIALLFLLLSGVRGAGRAILPGALLGGLGLTVLQTLSGLFVGGASSNPLLASFAALIALLLWVNLSAQVILIATAYIVEGALEAGDRVRVRHGAPTFVHRRVQKAEDAVGLATEELRAARDALAEQDAGQSAGQAAGADTKPPRTAAR
ncbi:YihY/virulence factor BrkB family protein [Microbacterium sp. W1N]|uniref:YihY/virulence factor BrkB family protein n=1 Tax=Microbacterium festucae TaxID=2977531 RepID=UPI0021C10297|nr:YihY/virulence factor BrkB family protein [Microbacterium festucae]MCT9821621.1 YihY/virulence factor BrkB family protein [Microbacterium festucae]